MARALRPDLVILDVEMPVMNGVEAVRLIREQLMDVKVIMLTVSDYEDHLLDALRNGAHGYLLKDLRPEQLLRHDPVGHAQRDPHLARPSPAGCSARSVRAAWERCRRRRPDGGAVGHPPRAGDPPARGGGPEQQGDRASGSSITEGTVKNHVHNALEKLHLENRIQAAAYVIRQGLGSPSGEDGH